jgi:DNA-binding MarR family transcriptional regulator
VTKARSNKPLTTEERELWHALKKLSDVSLASVGNTIEAETGLSGADFGILSRLVELGDGVLPQQSLQASLGWQKSRLSHQLTRMETRKLLRRCESETGRRVHVEILPKGTATIEAAYPVHAIAVREYVLKHIDAKEGAVLIQLVRRLEKSLEN